MIWLERFRAYLFRPIDVSLLVIFRIAFGLMMLWEVIRLFSNDRIQGDYIDVDMTFTYYGFEWVQPFAEPYYYMYIYFFVMGTAATCLAIGFYYRFSAILFAILMTYFFLLEKCRYQDHLYLATVISWVMIFIPAHRALSIDCARLPSRSTRVPAYNLYWIRFVVSMPYFFAGVAKLNYDWLVRAEPMRHFLLKRLDDLYNDHHYVGILIPTTVLRWLEADATAYLLAYAYAILELLIVPGFLWKRTRNAVYLFCAAFHLSNAILSDSTDILPWFMLAASLMYYPPDWPRIVIEQILQIRIIGTTVQLIRRVHKYIQYCCADSITLQNGQFVLKEHMLNKRETKQYAVAASCSSTNSTNVSSNKNKKETTKRFIEDSMNDGTSEPMTRNRNDAELMLKLKKESFTKDESIEVASTSPPPAVVRRQYCIMFGLTLFVLFQILFPLRHHWLYPVGGVLAVSWTEQGHDFSWHMGLHIKDSIFFYQLRHRTSRTTFLWDPQHIFDQSTTVARIRGPELRSHQERKFKTQPVMIMQVAHYLDDLYNHEFEIYAHVWASVNGRPYYRLIDPTIDLTTVRDTWAPLSWVIPLGQGDEVQTGLLRQHKRKRNLDVEDEDKEYGKRGQEERFDHLVLRSERQLRAHLVPP